MSADKHPADVLAVRSNSLADEAELIHLCSWVEIRNVLRGCAAMLRRIPALEAERDQLRAEVQALRADKDRIDWLADPENAIGNVQLPREVVEANLHSLRDAIDAARKAGP